jgi:molybdopterin converting factor small subunit
MLHTRTGRELSIEGPIVNVATLLEALDRRIPGLAAELSDPIYNFAVNDTMLLHGVRDHPIVDGDIVEVVPTISGG